MNPQPMRPDEDEIHAFVDGGLPSARRMEIEALLAEDTELAAEMAHFRAQNEALHALYDPLLDRPLPAGLDEVSLRRRRGRQGLAGAGRVAAVLALMALSAAGGWYAHQSTGEPVELAGGLPIDVAAVSAHRVYEAEVRHAVEVPVSEQEHLTRWLSKRLSSPLHLPDLTASGYTLMGGRLLPAGGLPAAHFLYESESGERLTLYIQPNHGGRETAFHFAEENGISAVFWREGKLAYAVIGRADRDTITGLASEAYQQLNP